MNRSLRSLATGMGRRAARLVGALVLSASLLAGPASARPILHLAYPDYWPFFSRTADGEMTGFFYDIVTEALDRIGVQVAWETYPWSRCQARVKAGESDAMVTVPTQERLAYAVTHEEPFYLKTLNIFTYRGHHDLAAIQAITTVDDIYRQGLTVVTYNGNGWNDKHIRARGIKVYEAPLIKSTWLMLAEQRGDIAIEWPEAAWPMIREAGLTGRIVQTDATLEAMPFHLLIGKRSPFADVIEPFNARILEMQADGTIRRLIGRYTAQP